MKLVLLFFCVIFSIFILILFSDLRLNIEKLYISNIEKGKKTKNLNCENLIYIEFYLLGILRIAKIRITKEMVKKVKIDTSPKAIEKDIQKMKNIKPLEILKKLKLKIKKLNLDLEIGTESIMLTVYLIPFISSILRNSFKYN